jgi:hypothetical protein
LFIFILIRLFFIFLLAITLSSFSYSRIRLCRCGATLSAGLFMILECRIRSFGLCSLLSSFLSSLFIISASTLFSTGLTVKIRCSIAFIPAFYSATFVFYQFMTAG